MSMTASSSPIIFLSGAGGGAPDLNVFRDGADDNTRIEVIRYPDWRHYVVNQLSADTLIKELAEQILAKVPQGPIRMVGLSIGGHFAYGIGLHLRARGREIAGFCAIDSFMFVSIAPSAQWKKRALEQGFELLRKRRFGEFADFLRSKFWRAWIRLVGDRLPLFLRALASARWLPSVLTSDPVVEGELSMRMLVRTTAPWLADLDRTPVPLEVPAVLLRTALAQGDDAAWRLRCPNIRILEIPGHHHNLFDPENVGALHEAFIAATEEWRAGHRVD
ncbi:thioesterase domain-containing protein [Bradyrhizobium sp. STM 3843]|uniref:thioesterase domain-containing protein n=1 Tax=Bradyrhizobium sp. STM 3843 TaxID=551947 RepID=UPI001FCA7B03|nr:thioesterase domain-containing protein [Bradyrhizobium sp. STM 3843]